MTTIAIVLITVLGLEAVSLVGLYFALKRPEVATRVRFIVNKYLGNYQMLDRADKAMGEISLLKAGHNQLSEGLQGLSSNDTEMADRIENLSDTIQELAEVLAKKADKKAPKAKKRTARR